MGTYLQACSYLYTRPWLASTIHGHFFSYLFCTFEPLLVIDPTSLLWLSSLIPERKKIRRKRTNSIIKEVCLMRGSTATGDPSPWWRMLNQLSNWFSFVLCLFVVNSLTLINESWSRENRNTNTNSITISIIFDNNNIV